jgi:hypothetical protein
MKMNLTTFPKRQPTFVFFIFYIQYHQCAQWNFQHELNTNATYYKIIESHVRTGIEKVYRLIN